MPKQDFDFVDYLGPVVAALIFAVCLLVIAFFFLNFFLVLKNDEPTVFERAGKKRNMRLGPHKRESMPTTESTQPLAQSAE
ncbi:hypothetical protein M3Y97_00278600 [Aphelenchoides bicaudatus]|nr:hypothetical protein M3Y97_00278600 [Aphelenchoides bicaudatus]